MGRILEYPPASAYEYKCKLCHDLSNLIWHPASMPLVSLKSSAENGCSICALIVGLYGHYVDVDDPERQNDVLETEAEDGYGTGGQFRAYLKIKEGREKGRRFVVWAQSIRRDRSTTYTGPTTPAWLQPFQNYLYEHERPDGADVKYIKDRWHECKEEHPSCNDQSEKIRSSLIATDMYRPKRLLYVGDFATTGRPLLTTAEETQWPQDLQYTALGYCGTVSEPICLTKANEEIRLSESPPPSLSKTFQDAIEVTLQLGIQYIWIDALCVFQDDPDERIEVSAHMASIYHNAELVLGAADSHFDGLFIPAPTIYETPFLHEGRSFDVLIRETLQNDFTYPLHNDGWGNLQLIVARRSIQFTREGLYWRCPLTNLSNTCTRAESKQELHAHSYMTPLISLPKRQEGLTAKTLIDAWKSATERGWVPIKNPDETLLVLSSLCKYIEASNVSLGGYYAGLWEKHLPAGLLWHSWWDGDINRPSIEGDVKTQQPSWSWISLQGARPYWPSDLLHDMVPAARIIDISVHSLTRDPHGSIQGGQLTIQGDMYAVRLKPSGPRADHRVLGEDHADNVEFVEEETQRAGFMKSLSCFRSHRKRIQYDWSFSNDHPMTPDIYGYKNKEVRYFLVICTSRKRRRPNGTKWVYSTQHHGLFLKELPYLELQEQPLVASFPAKMSVYNRIGYGMVTVEGQLGPLKQQCSKETVMII